MFESIESILRKVGAEGCEKSDASWRRDDGCAYSTFRKMVCSLDKDGTGEPIRKCERTENLLRKCAGQPAEVVDSKVESTEEDASTSHTPLSLDYGSSAGRRRTGSFPELLRRRGPALSRSEGNEEEILKDFLAALLTCQISLKDLPPRLSRVGAREVRLVVKLKILMLRMLLLQSNRNPSKMLPNIMNPLPEESRRFEKTPGKLWTTNYVIGMRILMV